MRKFIPVEEVAKVWMKDPAFVAAYDALDDEFAVASALIKARRDADMTQEQVARAMGTTQAVVARLESGRTMPSTRTLERFAKATRTRLRIGFELAKAQQPGHCTALFGASGAMIDEGISGSAPSRRSGTDSGAEHDLVDSRRGDHQSQRVLKLNSPACGEFGSPPRRDHAPSYRRAAASHRQSAPAGRTPSGGRRASRLPRS